MIPSAPRTSKPLPSTLKPSSPLRRQLQCPPPRTRAAPMDRVQRQRVPHTPALRHHRRLDAPRGTHPGHGTRRRHCAADIAPRHFHFFFACGCLMQLAIWPPVYYHLYDRPHSSTTLSGRCSSYSAASPLSTTASAPDPCAPSTGTWRSASLPSPHSPGKSSTAPCGEKHGALYRRSRTPGAPEPAGAGYQP